MVFIQPVVAKGVPAQLGGRDIFPASPDFSFERWWQERLHVSRGFGQLSGEGLLAHDQRLVSFIALQEVDITPGVMPDAGDQFDFVRQLDQIIVGAQGKGLRFDLGLLFGRQHDQGQVVRFGIGPEIAHQG